MAPQPGKRRLVDAGADADDLEGRRCVFLAALYRAESEIAEKLRTLAVGRPPWPFIDSNKVIRWVEPRTKLALRDGDVVVVWKLDRLSRSLKDVLHIMERIGDAGAGFRSITEAIDTTTPAGRMMMQMIGSFAEFERAMIRERTSAGIAAARAEGRVGGRRKKLDAAKRLEIAESVITGRKSGAEMARLYNISQPTVSRIVAQHRVVSP